MYNTIIENYIKMDFECEEILWPKRSGEVTNVYSSGRAYRFGVFQKIIEYIIAVKM